MYSTKLFIKLKKKTSSVLKIYWFLDELLVLKISVDKLWLVLSLQKNASPCQK